MTIQELHLRWREKIDSLDFFILLSYITQKNREYLIAHNNEVLPRLFVLQCNNLCKKRSSGIPLAYLVGEKEFYARTFVTNKHILIPRPETEILVEKTLHHYQNITKKNTPKSICILDVGTGSGCIIITLAKEIETHTNQKADTKNLFIGSDVSTKALRIAHLNASTYAANITLKKSDLLANPQLIKTITNFRPDELIITANLPYVPTSELKKTNDALTQGLRYEPQKALDGGDDGLDLYRKLFQDMRYILSKMPKVNVAIFCEINTYQKNSLKKIVQTSLRDTNVRFHKDLAGLWRVAQITLLQTK